ncbi:MAG: hypothetical protein U1G07_08305 [Verrucomicrobiota bacterium]
MNFASTADKYPAERASLARLERIVGEVAGGGVEYTFNRLCDLAKPRSREGFALALGELVQRGFLQQIVRVLSPTTQGGIAEYPSLRDVPPLIHDWRADLEFEVRPEHLLVIYRAQIPPSGHGHP